MRLSSDQGFVVVLLVLFAVALSVVVVAFGGIVAIVACVFGGFGYSIGVTVTASRHHGDPPRGGPDLGDALRLTKTIPDSKPAAAPFRHIAHQRAGPHGSATPARR